MAIGAMSSILQALGLGDDEKRKKPTGAGKAGENNRPPATDPGGVRTRTPGDPTIGGRLDGVSPTAARASEPVIGLPDPAAPAGLLEKRRVKTPPVGAAGRGTPQRRSLRRRNSRGVVQAG